MISPEGDYQQGLKRIVRNIKRWTVPKELGFLAIRIRRTAQRSILVRYKDGLPSPPGSPPFTSSGRTQFRYHGSQSYFYYPPGCQRGQSGGILFARPGWFILEYKAKEIERSVKERLRRFERTKKRQTKKFGGMYVAPGMMEQIAFLKSVNITRAKGPGGLLRKAIAYTVDEKAITIGAQLRIIHNIARLHERGGMGPGGRAGTGGGKKHSYPARPFMKPALMAHIKEMPAGVAGLVVNGLRFK